MARKRYKPEEIVAKLRQVDVLVSQGQGPAASRFFARLPRRFAFGHMATASERRRG
jgi:hypothetical protein